MTATRPRKSTSALNVDTAAQKKILRIGIVQNGRIMEERLLKNRGHISVGRGADNTFLIPSRDLPKSFRVFEERKNGYIMNFVKGMDARLALDGKIFTLNQILERGDFVTKNGPYNQLDLSSCSRGKLVIGEITLLFHFVPPPPELPKPQLPHVMWGLYALKDWLGAVFLLAILGSAFLTGGVIWAMNHFYDPQWKPNSEAANKLISRAIKRHEQAMKENLDDKNKSAKDSGKGDADGDKKKADAKAKPTVVRSDTKDVGPATKENIDNKISSITKNINNIKIDSKTLEGIKNIKVDAIPNVGNLNIPGTNNMVIPGNVTVNNGDAGSPVKEDIASAPCTGATCTVATHGKFTPGSTTSDNEYGSSGVTGTGGRKGPKGSSLPTGVNNIKIDVKIPTGMFVIPTTMIGNIMIAPIMIKAPVISTDSMAPERAKPPTVTGSASGLIPGGAPLGIRKMMGGVKYRVIACFQKAGAKGLVGAGTKSVRVTVSVSGGSLSVSGVSGFGASYFTSCVRGIRRKASDAESKKFSKSWTFTMHMIAKSSS
ncbi:hypothetical protein KKF84_05930 [Myxococcota bacterium]|nr:hypothetical protein [Myxococcota bacterium]